MAGVSAAEMAALGFTGAPAALFGMKLHRYLGDLGTVAVTPAIYQALAGLQMGTARVQAAVTLAERPFDIQQIDRIEIETFHESLRLASPTPPARMKPNTACAGRLPLCWLHCRRAGSSRL